MAREDKPLDGFGMFGLVKETDVDDAGICLSRVYLLNSPSSFVQLHRVG